MTTPPQPPSETPTPRTDAIHDKYELHCTTEEVDELYVLSAELEKELQEAKSSLQKACDFIGLQRQSNIDCSSERDLLKRSNGEMREALEGMSELCGNYFDESGLVCARDKEIWALHLKVLSSTPATQPSPSIPMDVAEKMYETLQFLIKQVDTKHEADSGYTSCPVCIALTAAEKHGLGKKL